MHRSSESVGSIATALAIAQTELTNPEKSMVGTIHHNNRGDNPQTFRYAPLSGGLEIVRRILGGQQIAVAQTTDVDRVNGLINLTTILMHSSGEWISSDWPVCALSEASAPRRMGAALTYARRYALFTLVGIAGEDDLDAPSDVTPDRPEGHAAVETGFAGAPSVGSGPARPSQFGIGKSGLPPGREKLSVEESAAMGAQLISEIETLPENDLQARAIAILKAKNRLLADHAKLVENAFAARTALSGASSEALTTDEVYSATADPVTPQAPPASTDPVKPLRRRGRPRKLKTTIEQSAALPVPSKPTTDENPPASTHHQTDDAPAKIQKSELWISEPRRLRDKGHLKFVGSQPCLVCGRSPADAHHLRFTQPRGMGLKVSDEFTVPLCRAHHRDNHNYGDEVAWWERRAIDPVAIARMLWISTRRIE
jgi:ERF superfamily